MESLDPPQQSESITKSGQFMQQLVTSLESQAELMIDFTSLKSCLNPLGICEQTEEEEDTSDQFDYDSFVTDLLNNHHQLLPNLKKLSIRRILELQCPTAITLDQHDHLSKINYGIMQLSSLSELDLCDLSSHCHGYLQLWGLSNLSKLSITRSQLSIFPSSVGSLRKLKVLDLSNNRLQFLPITLSFCQNLETLDLQNNSFTLLPSIILNLKNLTNLKRLGNPLTPAHSWSGPKFVKKITQNSSVKDESRKFQPLTLQETCTKEIFNIKLDYWEAGNVGVLQCRTLDHLAEKFYVCDNCSRALVDDPDAACFEVNVKLVTFKELAGVPFKLQACSEKCQDILAETYGNKNIELQHELDIKYENEIKNAQKDLEEGRIEQLPSASYTYTYNYYQRPVNQRRKKRCSIM